MTNILSRFITYRRQKKLSILVVAILLSIFLFFQIFPYFIIDVGYILRPIWDKNPSHFETIIPRHYAEGMSIQAQCAAHGWKAFPENNNNTLQQKKPKVYDAIMFLIEADLLEIRLNELWNVVDYFIIVEFNITQTGLPR